MTRKTYLVSSAVTAYNMCKKSFVVGFSVWSDGSAEIYLSLDKELRLDKDTWEEFNLRYNIYEL